MDAETSSYFKNLSETVARLREEGKERTDKLEQVLLQTTKTNGRVTRLEERERDRDEKIDKIEKRIWQIAAVLGLILGSADQIMQIFK